MPPPHFADKTNIKVRALFIGERIDLRALETTHRLAMSPLAVGAGTEGCAVLLRYGVVVLFAIAPLEEVAFLKHIEPLVGEKFPVAEIEEVEIALDSGMGERVDNGVIYLREFSIEPLQIIADILAKSVVLAYHEASVARVFDKIEPMAVGLQQEGRGWRKSEELIRYIGGALLVEHKMVGRVEVGEKPELLWERPELERLYARLEDEYEIHERHLALERKLGLVSRTAETLLDLLQHHRSLRVEWYIVVLIVLEILLSLYQIFVGPNP
jgi:uncharacterized Rmd1/YagE family protein